MSYILLPNDGIPIPHEIIKQITEQPEFNTLPFARLIIHLSTNLTKSCKIILNNKMIVSPYRSGIIANGKKLPPLDKPIGSSSNDIWIPRGELNKNTRPWFAPAVPVPGSPPPKPTAIELNTRPPPIVPISPIYVYPLSNPDPDETARREQATRLEKDTLSNWDFLQKQIEIKLNNIFFGNNDGVGDKWQNVVLRLPSSSQPSNPIADKLYKLKAKPSFDGKKIGGNWKTFSGTERYNPVTIPSDYNKPGNYLSLFTPLPPAGAPLDPTIRNNLPTPLPSPPKGINPHSKVKNYKFFVYPIYRKFHRVEHPDSPSRPYWPPLSWIASGDYAPPPPLSTFNLPSRSPPGSALAADGRAWFFTDPNFNDPELHININIDLDIKEIKKEAGETFDSKINEHKKQAAKPPPEGAMAKTKSFCQDNISNIADLGKDLAGIGPGKAYVDGSKIRDKKSIRDHQNIATRQTAIVKERNEFSRGLWMCGGKKTKRKKKRKKRKTLKLKNKRQKKKKKTSRKKSIQKGGNKIKKKSEKIKAMQKKISKINLL